MCFSSRKKETDKWTIMISYAHTDEELCRKMLHELRQRNASLKVWIDFEQDLTGDLWECIANGIDNSNVIVCITSLDYFQSKSCRQEFTYANDTKSKPIVPVYVEGFKPDGWLGKLIEIK